jgi:hypothetical protein
MVTGSEMKDVLRAEKRVAAIINYQNEEVMHS